MRLLSVLHSITSCLDIRVLAKKSDILVIKELIANFSTQNKLIPFLSIVNVSKRKDIPYLKRIKFKFKQIEFRELLTIRFECHGSSGMTIIKCHSRCGTLKKKPSKLDDYECRV